MFSPKSCFVCGRLISSRLRLTVDDYPGKVTGFYCGIRTHARIHLPILPPTHALSRKHPSPNPSAASHTLSPTYTSAQSPPTYPFTHSPNDMPPTHSSTRAPSPFTPAPPTNQLFTHQPACSSTHPFIHSPFQSSIHQLTDSPIHLATKSLTYPPCHSVTH